MGVVATRAVTLFKGTVVVGIAVQDRLHVRNRAVLTVVVPVMAPQAKFSRLRYELLRIF